MIGEVKSFNPQTGYGFITSEGEDYLFRSRYSRGERVEFDPIRGEKGFQATNIRKIGKNNESLRRHIEDKRDRSPVS